MFLKGKEEQARGTRKGCPALFITRFNLSARFQDGALKTRHAGEAVFAGIASGCYADTRIALTGQPLAASRTRLPVPSGWA